jgi:hypothetical protein
MTRSSDPVRPSRRRLLNLAAGLLAAASLPAQARRYEGYDFADKLQLDGSALVLNGVGMRAVAILKGYLAALYLGRPAATPAEVYATPGPKRIQIRMLLGVDTQEFIKAVDKGVRRNCSEAERTVLAAGPLPQFMAQMKAVGRVRDKDLIDMDFLPGRGTLLSINGRPAGEAVAGSELYLALLKVFLGERPVDPRLKAGLLGA